MMSARKQGQSAYVTEAATYIFPTLGRENKIIVPECSKRLKFANPSVGLKNLVPVFSARAPKSSHGEYIYTTNNHFREFEFVYLGVTKSWNVGLVLSIRCIYIFSMFLFRLARRKKSNFFWNSTHEAVLYRNGFRTRTRAYPLRSFISLSQGGR